MKSTVRAGIALMIFLIASLSVSVAGQQSSDQSDPLAKRSDIYCTGPMFRRALIFKSSEQKRRI